MQKKQTLSHRSLRGNTVCQCQLRASCIRALITGNKGWAKYLHTPLGERLRLESERNRKMTWWLGKWGLASVTLSEGLSTGDTHRSEQRKTLLMRIQLQPHTREKNTPQRREFEYTQPCLISTPYSPAGTVESHSNVISAFKRAVFTASLHLTNIPSDVIIIFIQSSLVSHYTRSRRPLKVLVIQVLAIAVTQRSESQSHHPIQLTTGPTKIWVKLTLSTVNIKKKKKHQTKTDKACQCDSMRGDIHYAKLWTEHTNRPTGPAGQMEPTAIF